MKIEILDSPKVSNELESLIKEKLEKLETYFQRIVHAEVFLKESQEVSKGKIVDVRLFVPGPELFASGESDTYEKALSITVEKLRKQLIKYKEKLQERK